MIPLHQEQPDLVSFQNTAIPGLIRIQTPAGGFTAVRGHARFAAMTLPARQFAKGKTSVIYELDGESLLKVCLTQSFPRNPLLRTIGLSRAKIEQASNATLQKLGLNAPRIMATSTAINPFSRLDSALIIQRIPNAACAIPFLNDESIPIAVRHHFLDQVIAGLKTMTREKLALRDFRLNNIMVTDTDRTPIWIDNDLKHCCTRNQLVDKLNTTTRRVLLKDTLLIPDAFAARLRNELQGVIQIAQKARESSHGLTLLASLPLAGTLTELPRITEAASSVFTDV